jgi:hypothetical protein
MNLFHANFLNNLSNYNDDDDDDDDDDGMKYLNLVVMDYP